MKYVRPPGRGIPRPQTSRLLRHLLLHEGVYRKQWMRFVRRAGRTQVHQAAVARVIAHFMWDIGECDERDSSVPRRMRDTVHRALTNGSISSQTLHYFIDAFVMSEAHAAQLWDHFAKDGETGEISQSPIAAASASECAHSFRTLSLCERRFVGQDGIPYQQETSRVIQANAPIDRFQTVHDTSQVVMTVHRGGTPGDVYAVHHPRWATHAVDINFASTLLPGETAALSYRSVYRFCSPTADHFRCTIGEDIRSVVLEVDFYPRRLPAQVIFAHWPDPDGPPIDVAEVGLSTEGTVHRYLEDVRQRTVGFYWEWD